MGSNLELPLFETRLFGTRRENGLALLVEALRSRTRPRIEWQIAHAPDGSLRDVWRAPGNDPAAMAWLAAVASPRGAAAVATALLNAVGNELRGEDRRRVRRAARAAALRDDGRLRALAVAPAPYRAVLIHAAGLLAERPYERGEAAEALVGDLRGTERIRALLAQRVPAPTLAEALEADLARHKRPPPPPPLPLPPKDWRFPPGARLVGGAQVVSARKNPSARATPATRRTRRPATR